MNRITAATYFLIEETRDDKELMKEATFIPFLSCSQSPEGIVLSKAQGPVN